MNCKLCKKPFDIDHNCKFGIHESEWTEDFFKHISSYTKRELFSAGHSAKMKIIATREIDLMGFHPSEVIFVGTWFENALGGSLALEDFLNRAPKPKVQYVNEY